MADLDAHYSAQDIDARILAALRAAGLDLDQPLSPAALGALDHFHTGGFRASLVLLNCRRFEPKTRSSILAPASPARHVCWLLGQVVRSTASTCRPIIAAPQSYSIG